VESKPITGQLMEFNKILDDSANIEVNVDDEDKTLLLLCSLPKFFLGILQIPSFTERKTPLFEGGPSGFEYYKGEE
jgi:hypothetical protein